MPDLAAFQRDFATALLSDEQPAPPFRTQAFTVYRNTSARGAVEALRASFPTVDMLVGEEMFTQAALDYRRDHLPSDPVLSNYGREFPAFLARQPWTCELPYLADVARLDWLWLDSFLAPDLVARAHARTVGSSICLHPAARFAWLATPAMTIWLAHRDPWEMADLEPEWVEEGALFTRAGFSVRAHQIDASFHRLLLACGAPALAGDIASAVANAFPSANIPELLQHGVATGALVIQ